jgi:anaerobic magnesium-protoporphyrin IX monomethyl ester cyclase
MNLFSLVSIGEAERSLPDLLDRIDKGEDLSDTPGFWCKEINGNIKRNIIQELEPNIDSNPFPDYSIFNISEIEKANNGWVALMITRGCPYNCYYCCNHILRSLYPNQKTYVRIPKPNHAIKIIKNVLKYYKEPKGIAFADDLLIINEDWFLEFARLYKEHINLPFTCNGRFNHFTENIIKSLKHSGCREIHLGIESGSEWLRRNVINRPSSNKQIIDCFKLLKQAGIKTFAYNIIGFPFETKNLMYDTFRINKFAKPDRGAIFYFYPFPGTKLFNVCKQYNLLIDEDKLPFGYRDKLTIKDIHCSEKDCRKIYNKIYLYFLSRTIVDAVGLPKVFKAIIYTIFNVSPYFFVTLTSKRSKIKTVLRSWLYKLRH